MHVRDIWKQLSYLLYVVVSSQVRTRLTHNEMRIWFPETEFGGTIIYENVHECLETST